MDLALFDFDGTITDRETMPGFVRAATRPVRLKVGLVVLAPLVVGYKHRVVPGTMVRAAICWFGFRGVPVRELEQHGVAFAQSVLPAMLRPEAMARIAWHKARGDRIVVVSGGLDVYLAHWASSHGLELLCSSLEQRDGRLTGYYNGAQCVRDEKVRRVKALCSTQDFGKVYAYGDTPEDHAMLAMADEAYYRGKPWVQPQD